MCLTYIGKNCCRPVGADQSPIWTSRWSTNIFHIYDEPQALCNTVKYIVKFGMGYYLNASGFQFPGLSRATMILHGFAFEGIFSNFST